MHSCNKCDVDISYLHPNARYCADCAPVIKQERLIANRIKARGRNVVPRNPKPIDPKWLVRGPIYDV